MHINVIVEWNSEIAQSDENWNWCLSRTDDTRSRKGNLFSLYPFIQHTYRRLVWLYGLNRNNVRCSFSVFFFFLSIHSAYWPGNRRLIQLYGLNKDNIRCDFVFTLLYHRTIFIIFLDFMLCDFPISTTVYIYIFLSFNFMNFVNKL